MHVFFFSLSPVYPCPETISNSVDYYRASLLQRAWLFEWGLLQAPLVFSTSEAPEQRSTTFSLQKQTEDSVC